MLIASIDRNRPTEPERQIERVPSTNQVEQAYHSKEYADYRRSQQKRKGVILRKGDKRKQERRQDYVELSNKDMEKRQGKNNRRSVDKWDSNTHDLVLIALEKNSNPDWNEGDQVVLGQQIHRQPPSNRDIIPDAVSEPEIDSSPPLDSGQDYVLHLSINKGTFGKSGQRPPELPEREIWTRDIVWLRKILKQSMNVFFKSKWLDGLNCSSELWSIPTGRGPAPHKVT